MKSLKKTTKSYTQICKSRYKLFTALSWFLCFGICAFLIIVALSGGPVAKATSIKILSDEATAALYSLGISALVVAILSIIVKDKIEPTVWMVNIILAGYLFSMTAVYIIFAIWFMDNYLIKTLKNRYKNKYEINREIDKRETK